MRPVRRDEIVDYQTYDEQRASLRTEVLAEKEPRRIHVPPALTFLFETTNTVRYQIQEMMRVEHIVKEADILHELETYNDLLGGPGELGATLLIEIEDQAERAVLLKAWRDLPAHIYAELDDGEKVFASFDQKQVGDDRLSSVQYLKFDVKGRTPVALGVEHPKLTGRLELGEGQKKALEEDLKGTGS